MVSADELLALKVIYNRNWTHRKTIAAGLGYGDDREKAQAMIDTLLEQGLVRRAAFDNFKDETSWVAITDKGKDMLVKNNAL